MKVIFNSNTRLAKNTLKSVRSYRVNAEIIKANVSEEKEVKYLIKETEKTFNEYDIILSPSFGKNQLLITNLTGHPAISLPDGLDTEGRPTSISIIGNYGDEDKMLYFAEYLNKKINFFKNKPPLFY